MTTNLFTKLLMMISLFSKSEQKPSHAEAPMGKDRADDLPPIACDLTVLPPEQRVAQVAFAKDRLFGEALETLELPDGYALRFEADYYPALAQFVANERLCCPFFKFVLEVTPARGPVWLRLTGHQGVKEFINALINHEA